MDRAENTHTGKHSGWRERKTHTGLWMYRAKNTHRTTRFSVDKYTQENTHARTHTHTHTQNAHTHYTHTELSLSLSISHTHHTHSTSHKRV